MNTMTAQAATGLRHYAFGLVTVGLLAFAPATATAQCPQCRSEPAPTMSNCWWNDIDKMHSKVSGSESVGYEIYHLNNRCGSCADAHCTCPYNDCPPPAGGGIEDDVDEGLLASVLRSDDPTGLLAVRERLRRSSRVAITGNLLVLRGCDGKPVAQYRLSRRQLVMLLG